MSACINATLINSYRIIEKTIQQLTFAKLCRQRQLVNRILTSNLHVFSERAGMECPAVLLLISQF